MGIVKENKIVRTILDMVKDSGLLSTIRFFGGVEELEEIFDFDMLMKDDKIRFIRDVVMNNGGEINFFDYDINIVKVLETDEYWEEIQFIFQDGVQVDKMDILTNDYISSKNLSYESLGDDIIDDLTLKMIDIVNN